MNGFYGREALIALSLKYAGDWNAIYLGMRSREDLDVEGTLKAIAALSCKAVTYLDPEYPDYLRKSCPQPPFVLYYYGDLSLIQDRSKVLTVVGSREPSDYALKKTRSLCQAIVDRGYIVCSGLAKGIDTCAAEATASFPGKSIAVLGCGLRRCYPAENLELQKRIAKNGLVITEYPEFTPPDAIHFPARNRLLAAFCQGVFVGQVTPRSGTMITVAYALEMARDVGALPFPADEEASNNQLIKTGSALIENVDDLELFLSVPSRKQTP